VPGGEVDGLTWSARLEGETVARMTTEDPGSVVPAGYSRIDPWVISRDTDAEIRFLSRVFGAQERGARMVNDDGTVAHAEIQVGESVVLMFDAQPGWPELPAHVRIYVDDVASSVEEAVAAGARVVTRPTELAFGEIVARVRDPQGHLWWMHQRVEELDPEEMNRRFGDPSFIEAMAYVQESLTEELSGRNR
jgi:PhnB protein